jgi:drug/metabolite transporter (DMT)-like permease
MTPPLLLNRLWSTASLLLALASLFWAGNFIVGRAFGASGTGLSPVALAFWRWLAAFALVLLIGGGKAWADRRRILRALPLLVYYGLLSVTLYNTLIYIGLKETTTISALLLQSTMPVIILMCCAGIYRERITLQQIGGIIVSLFGLLWVLTRGNPAQVTGMDLGFGSVIVLLGVASNALYFATLRSRPDMHPLSFLVMTFGTGTALLFPIWIWQSAQVPSNIMQIGAIGYLALFSSLLALLFFNRGVALIGSARAGAFLHLMPVFGTILSIVFLGEKLRGFHVTGFVLVLCGVFLATTRFRFDRSFVEEEP